jgi:F-box-like
VTINALPDEILLNIFGFCKVETVKAPYLWSGQWTNTWRNLVHVCQRWRYVVFSFPLGLDLRLYCTDRTKVLDIWPPFPIEIISFKLGNNIFAALEHHDRIYDLDLYPSSYSKFEKLVTMMRNPFPALTFLRLVCTGEFDHVPVLPDTFLGGSAPHLGTLYLESIAFPNLPQFLLSSNDLLALCLLNIPDFGYISPDAMATILSGLTRLKSLWIEFEKEESGMIRGRPRPPPLTHALLPALTNFSFRGLNEYLEDLLARIDAPQIKTLFISLFRQPIFDIQQVIFRSRPLGPFDYARVTSGRYTVLIRLDQSKGTAPSRMELKIGQRTPGRQLSSLVRICTQSSSLLSSVTNLDIIDKGPFSELVDEEDLMNNPQWLILFDSFTAARTLRLSGGILWFIVSLLGGLTRERAIEVLPNLQNLYVRVPHWRDELEGPMKNFIAARQHSDHPVTWRLIAGG